MAAESATASGRMSAAQRLLQEHTNDAAEASSSANAHRPTVEEVVDEEDILHPPPSATFKRDNEEAFSKNSNLPPIGSNGMSEKAFGKQKMQPGTQNQDAGKPKGVNATSKQSGQPVLNTQSEDMFPALSAPKQNSAASTSAWGRKPASLAASNTAKSVSGIQSPPNGKLSSPGASSPSSSGMVTPNSMSTALVSGKGSTASVMSLPGRHTESIQFAPSQLIPRQQLKKPIPDVLREINRRSKAKVESRPGAGDVLIFEGQGPVDAVRQALKEVAIQVGSKVGVLIVLDSA